MHIPVFGKTILELLPLSPGNIVVDCTLGLGGHTKLFANAVGDTGKVIGIEWDERNLHIAKETIRNEKSNITFVHDSYKNIDTILHNLGLMQKIDLIFWDIGVSSLHFDDPMRGFSFRQDGPLDMRFDQRQEETAKTIVNSYDVESLTRVIKEYGEEPFAYRIAKNIVEKRKIGIIQTTTQLVALIEEAVPLWEKRKDALVRVFQSLRIQVNDELNNIKTALEKGFGGLKTGGKLAVISFHSLEDRIVKQFFHAQSQGCICSKISPVCTCHNLPKAILVTKKPHNPSIEEIQENPRARSAHLRILQKL